MFRLEQESQGYKIYFGDRNTIKAKNENEAINALKHYFMKKHNSRKCPSCYYQKANLLSEQKL